MSILRRLKFTSLVTVIAVATSLVAPSAASAATDPTLPTGTFFTGRDTPISGNYKTGVSTYDDKGITKAEVYIDGKFYMPTTDGFGFNFDSEKVEDGTYKVEVKLYDADGNTAYATSSDGYPYLNLIVAHGDIFKPSGTFTGISQNQTVSGTVSLRVQAKDNKAVVRVEFFGDGKSLGVDSLATNGNYVFDWDTTTISEGIHTVTANIFDTNGNSAWATVDGTPSLDVVVRNGTEAATTEQAAEKDTTVTKKAATATDTRPMGQASNTLAAKIAVVSIVILAILLALAYRFGLLKLIEVKLRGGLSPGRRK